MTDKEMADALQEAKAVKAKIAADLLKQPPGFMRWLLTIPYRLVKWVEKAAREELRNP